MEAIILAGGKGTRLKSVLREIPKPMAPIGNIPFLEIILRYLKTVGINRIILSVGYKHNVIKNYFGNRYQGMAIIYSIENNPLGTGGAMKQALSYCKNDHVFIFNGDTFFGVDLHIMKNVLKPETKLVLALKEELSFDRYGSVKINENGVVVDFREKEYCNRGYINGGIYLAKKDIFQSHNTETSFSFEDFMKNHVKELNINSAIFEPYFIDIGIPEDYKKAQSELTDSNNCI